MTSITGTVCHWIFQANPKLWAVTEHLEQLQPGSHDRWLVTRYREEMQPGDQVAIWQSGERSGIYAFGTLLGVPEQLTDHLPYQKKAGLTDQPPGFAVTYQVTQIFPAGLSREMIQADQRLSELSILHFANATNFRVTARQWQALMDLAALATGGELTRDEQVWTEGSQKLVTHLRRERAAGLAAAKKAQFTEQHGHLYCEKCGIAPVQIYGPEGVACIEVHHRIPLADTGHDHKTKLDDLECLCANCHRVEHQRLKTAALLML